MRYKVSSAWVYKRFKITETRHKRIMEVVRRYKDVNIRIEQLRKNFKNLNISIEVVTTGGIGSFFHIGNRVGLQIAASISKKTGHNRYTSTARCIMFQPKAFFLKILEKDEAKMEEVE